MLSADVLEFPRSGSLKTIRAAWLPEQDFGTERGRSSRMAGGCISSLLNRIVS